MADDLVLGDHVKDSVTGFQGMIVARTQWLFGCKRAEVQPQRLDDTGSPVKSLWFDEAQLLPDSGETSTSPGGPRDDPKRAEDPRR
jgi:hypothetical protein